MGNKIKGIESEGMSLSLYVDGIAFRVVTIIDGYRIDKIFIDYQEASSYFESVIVGN